MRFKLAIATLALLIGSFASAEVRPGSSIRTSIESSNKVELEADLREMGVEDPLLDATIDSIIKSHNDGIITSSKIADLLSITDSSKKDLVKKYVSELLPAAVNASANNAGAAAMMSVSSNENSTAALRVDEIKQAGNQIIASTQTDVSMDNMPAIMDLLKDVAEGRVTEEAANTLIASQNLMNRDEVTDGDFLKAWRQCD